jgi:hypothetical protein
LFEQDGDSMDNATAMDDNVVNMDDPLWIMSLLQHKKKGPKDRRMHDQGGQVPL